MFFIMHQINKYEDWEIRAETKTKIFLRLLTIINKAYLKFYISFSISQLKTGKSLHKRITN